MEEFLPMETVDEKEYYDTKSKDHELASIHRGQVVENDVVGGQTIVLEYVGRDTVLGYNTSRASKT